MRTLVAFIIILFHVNFSQRHIPQFSTSKAPDTGLGVILLYSRGNHPPLIAGEAARDDVGDSSSRPLLPELADRVPRVVSAPEQSERVHCHVGNVALKEARLRNKNFLFHMLCF